MSAKSHFTTRRGFIAACGFGIVGLYGLWAGYGAAPLPSFGLGNHGGHGDDAHGGAGAPADSHSGGHGAATTLTPEEFRRLAEDFAARHARGANEASASHAGHGAAHMVSGESDDIYLMAYQWGFTPDALRLESGRTYRLRMMAVDVSHGAAIRLGPGSRIVRLRANTLVEQTTTFSRPGDYLVYCTVYCGPGHARMQSRLIVT